MAKANAVLWWRNINETAPPVANEDQPETSQDAANDADDATLESDYARRKREWNEIAAEILGSEKDLDAAKSERERIIRAFRIEIERLDEIVNRALERRAAAREKFTVKSLELNAEVNWSGE